MARESKLGAFMATILAPGAAASEPARSPPKVPIRVTPSRRRVAHGKMRPWFSSEQDNRRSRRI